MAAVLSLDAAIVAGSTLTITGVAMPSSAFLEGVLRFGWQALPLLTLAAAVQFVRWRDAPIRERVFAALFLVAANILALLGAVWALTAIDEIIYA